ncbi:hypothetical protein FPV67DRAFT_1730999 [Lyophyllum atratum]|nr:hypothetical protein FPV67DRAFT_1730999 [Lyophyllum atratum]
MEIKIAALPTLASQRYRLHHKIQTRVLVQAPSPIFPQHRFRSHPAAMRKTGVLQLGLLTKLNPAPSPGHSSLGTFSVADHASSGLRAPPVVFPCAVAEPLSIVPSTDPPSRAHTSASSAPRSRVSHVTPSAAEVGPPEAIPLTVSPSPAYAPSPAAGPSAPRRPHGFDSQVLRPPDGPEPSRTKKTTSKLPKFKRIAADASPSIPSIPYDPSAPSSSFNRLPIPPSRIDASTSDIHPSLSSRQTKPVPKECPCTWTSVGGTCKKCSEAETQALSKKAPAPTDPPSAPEGDVAPGHSQPTRSTTAAGYPVIPPPPAIVLSAQTRLSPPHDWIESPPSPACSCSRTRFDRNCKVCCDYVQRDIFSSFRQPSISTNLPSTGDENGHHSRLSNMDRNSKADTEAGPRANFDRHLHQAVTSGQGYPSMSGVPPSWRRDLRYRDQMGNRAPDQYQDLAFGLPYPYYSSERMSDDHRERPRDPRPLIKREPAPPPHLWAWPPDVGGQYPDDTLPWIEPTSTASGWSLPSPTNAQMLPPNLPARVQDPPPPIEIDVDGPHHAGPST